MKLKKLFIILSAAILGSSGSAAYSADNKFLSEAAKIVWEKYPEMFDATKEIPPKLVEKNDAVILAELNYLKTRQDAHSPDGLASTAGW